MSTQPETDRVTEALWRLRPGQAVHLPASRSTRWLRLRDGALWITADGRADADAPLPDDWWLRPGETLRVPAGTRLLAEGWPFASFELLEAPQR